MLVRLLIFLCIANPLFYYEAHAQNSNADNIYLTVRKPLLCNFRNVDDLLRPFVLKDALEVHIKVKQKPCKVLASIQFSTSAAQNTFAGKILLKQASTTSSTATVINTSIPLLNSPTTLFIQPALGSRTNHYYFNYDLILSPLKTFVSPGDYNFSIIFTMTDP